MNRMVVGLLALAAVLALTAAAWTGHQVRDEQQAHRAARGALEAGRSAAVEFTSYDYRHLDTDLDRVANRSTGAFRKQFTSALGTLTDAIKKAHGVSAGHVTYAGLVQHNDRSATVVAAVDASITNSATSGATTRRYRLKITLDHSSGSWLISQIAPVP